MRGLAMRAGEGALVLPLFLTFMLLFAAPLVLLLGVSLHNDPELEQWGLLTWKKFVQDGFYWQATLDTLRLGATTVVAAVLLGYPLALTYLSLGERGQRILLFIIIMPLLLSVVVRTFAWIVILSHEGVVNQTLLALGLTAAPLRLLQTELGLVISLTQIELPMLLLPLIAALSRLDRNLFDASSILGASRWRTLFKVILPLSLPGLIAGCTLVFASSTTAFISQSVIGGNRLVYLPLLIWQQTSVVYHWPMAAVISIVLLCTVLACLYVINLMGRKSMRYLHV
ncbi:ABC transporter permease [Comamonas endophytica]|uniref:ABC transporter permease n=1 Tax=Comamonas endophytica TaxID=2949090 RepID=A0ABY6GEP4_9BURK|nr:MULTISPECIES: ABC transporter permease [unclassified Acidovorax]MCD2512691.1 ABC transporter permease [Acidovorax sp. D4N7]UYG52954.1 ABC transporter permease [Acidovorax sp. 5MLIR]